MTHRCSIILEKITGPADVSQDEKMGIVWKLLGNTQYHHKNEEKPYTWSFDTSDNKFFTLVFSSIIPDVSEQIFNYATQLKGQAISEMGVIWKITDTLSIEDEAFWGNFLRVSSLVGAVVMRGRTSVKAKDNPELFKSMIANQLARRTERFMHEKVDLEQIHVKFPSSIGYGFTPYKGGNIPWESVTFKLVAPEAVLKTAYYGGIGQKTGSGFGFIIPGY